MLVDKDRVPTDTNQVGLEQDWEVRWWCDRFGCTEVALRSAVARVGSSAPQVERELQAAGKAAFRNTGED